VVPTRPSEPEESAPVSDVVFVAAIVAFFVVAALLVVGCDRIIGPDPPPGALEDGSDDDDADADVSETEAG